VPLVVLTARRDLNTRLEAFKAGAHDYIEKPFAVQELVARVNVHLKIKKQQDELAQRNYDLELMNRARQDMTDMILHDLKTPLASIKGTLEIIKMRGLISNNSYSGLLDNAGTAADFMLLMLNDLLDIAQTEQMGLRVRVAKFETKPMVERLTVLFSARFNTLGLTLAFNVAPGAGVLDTDQNLIFRVLVNLISNAMKVSSRGGRVEVDIGVTQSRVRLTVADRGPGVADDLKKVIFNKFVTTSVPNISEDGGRGIGLTFCRLAVATLNGTILVEDREGGGSMFVVEVPSGVQQAPAAAAKA
jgi:two-component system, sensor histidine kinase and response regulator